MIFTDGSAQGNPGPTGSGVVIKNPRHHGSPIKLAKASYHFLWHKFLLYIVFKTNDRKSHCVWNTLYSVGWSLGVYIVIIYVFIYLFISCYGSTHRWF